MDNNLKDILVNKPERESSASEFENSPPGQVERCEGIGIPQSSKAGKRKLLVMKPVELEKLMRGAIVDLSTNDTAQIEPGGTDKPTLYKK